MAIGRSINLFLLDGNPDDVIVGELYNWTGKTYKIPRNSLKELSTRSDLKKAGVYFLFGRDTDDNLAIYIGETEEVNSIPKSFKQKREGLIKDNIIKDWVFSKDYLFSSPSTAAGVIMGRSANGLIEWKKKDGTTIKDNE